MRLYIAFALFLVFFLSINIAFLDNLRKIWGVSYPLVLVAINLDLLVLVVVFMIFFRKFLKTYLAGRRAPLRRKLSTSLMLYIITPLLFLNLITAVILLQATKSYISGQLKEVAKRSENLVMLLQEEEKERKEEYRELFQRLSAYGLEAESLKKVAGVKEILRDPQCSEENNDRALILCLQGYRIEIERGRQTKELVEDIHKTAIELRNMVKARDVIGGIYVYFLLLVGFVSFLSAVWFGNLIARHITLPLEKLTQKSREIARGNFEVSVEVPQSGDEVQELAVSFLRMKEELKDLYGRLQKEREMLLELFNALPVGIVFISKEGESFKNRTYEELSKKASVKESSIDLALGKLFIYEDLESIILAERFRTWQMAVKRIAHEIKNPLTPISLNLERLIRLLDRGECNPESLTPMVRLMLEELHRIKKIVDQFRSLSTEVEPQFTELQLEELLQQVARMYGDIHISVEGRLRILGDERLLRDMFFNLFNNSLEWGAKRVWVELKEGEIIYRDDGVGIEKGKEELIFLPYHSENPKGMGLGLAVVKHIAELHGWKVRALAQEGGFYLLVEFKSKKGII